MHINLNAMGTRMKRRRKELKMSQAELAEKVNVPTIIFLRLKPENRFQA